MTSLKHQVNRMNELLDQLIQTAKKLRDVSQQVISEDELAPLQKHQDELLAELLSLDQSLQQYDQSDIDSKIHQQFHDKLHEFQVLNQEFINNLRASHGLIQFELRQIEETPEEELSAFQATLRRLNKMSFSRDRSKTVQSQKNKKSG